MMDDDSIRGLVYRETCLDGCGKGLPIHVNSRGQGWHLQLPLGVGEFLCTRNFSLAEKVVELVKGEREACARIAETEEDAWSSCPGVYESCKRDIAAAIRARGVERVKEGSADE